MDEVSLSSSSSSFTLPLPKLVFGIASALGSFYLGLSGFGNAIGFLFVYQLAVLISGSGNNDEESTAPSSSTSYDLKAAIKLSTVMSAATVSVLVVLELRRAIKGYRVSRKTGIWLKVNKIYNNENLNDNENGNQDISSSGDLSDIENNNTKSLNGIERVLGNNGRIPLMVLIMICCTAIGTIPGNVLGKILNRQIVAGVASFFLLLFVVLHGIKTYLVGSSRSKLLRIFWKNDTGNEKSLLTSSIEMNALKYVADAEELMEINSADAGDEENVPEIVALDADSLDDDECNDEMSKSKLIQIDGKSDTPPALAPIASQTIVTPFVLTMSAIAGLASGLFGGMTALRGPPTIMFFMIYPFTPSVTRAIGTSMAAVNVIFRMGFYFAAGDFRGDEIGLYFCIALSGLLGLLLGLICFHYYLDTSTERGTDTDNKVEKRKSANTKLLSHVFMVLLLVCGLSLIITAVSPST